MAVHTRVMISTVTSLRVYLLAASKLTTPNPTNGFLEGSMGTVLHKKLMKDMCRARTGGNGGKCGNVADKEAG